MTWKWALQQWWRWDAQISPWEAQWNEAPPAAPVGHRCICRWPSFSQSAFQSSWAGWGQWGRPPPGRNRLALFLSSLSSSSSSHGIQTCVGSEDPPPHLPIHLLQHPIPHFNSLWIYFHYVTEHSINTCFRVLVWVSSHWLSFSWDWVILSCFLEGCINLDSFLTLWILFCSDSGFCYIPLKSVLWLLQHTNLVGIKVQALSLDGSSDFVLSWPACICLIYACSRHISTDFMNALLPRISTQFSHIYGCPTF